MQITFDTNDGLEEVQKVLDALTGRTTADITGNGDGEVLPEPAQKPPVVPEPPPVQPQSEGTAPVVESDPAELFKDAAPMASKVLVSPPTGVVPPPPPPVVTTTEVETHWTSRSTPRVAIPWDARIHASTKTTTAKGAWKMKPGVDKGVALAVEAELAGNAPAPGEAEITDYLSLVQKVSTYLKALGRPEAMTAVVMPVATRVLTEAGLDGTKGALGFQHKDATPALMQKFYEEMEAGCKNLPTPS